MARRGGDAGPAVDVDHRRSRSAAGVPSWRSSTAASTSAIWVQRMRPSRNAATATSLAALSQAGAVPPGPAGGVGQAPGRRRRRGRGARSRGAPSAVQSMPPNGGGRSVRDRPGRSRWAGACRAGTAGRWWSRRCRSTIECTIDWGWTTTSIWSKPDADAVVAGGRAEQLVGLDDLEALVHQRRRVDRDLGPHRPRGMGQGVVDGDLGQLGGACGPGTGPPLAVSTSSADPGRVVVGPQALVDGAVLAVDRHQLGARRAPGAAGPPGRRR